MEALLIDLDDILGLASDKYNTFQTLWSLYVAIATGILAILVTNAKAFKSILPRILLIIAFIAYALTSMMEMHKICMDRYLLSEEARKILRLESNENKRCGFLSYKCKTKIFNNHKNRPIDAYVLNMTYSYPNDVIFFHLLIDVIVIMLIWLLPHTLIRLKPPNEISKKKIIIRKSSLPNPIVSYNTNNDIWYLDHSIIIQGDKLITFDDFDNKIQELQVPAGFEFDLATIPRFIWSFIAPFELSIIAPLIHDYIYICEGRFSKNPNGKLVSDENGANMISRKEADDLFLYHMKLENIGFFRRWFAYYGVRIFGNLYWKEN